MKKVFYRIFVLVICFVGLLPSFFVDSDCNSYNVYYWDEEQNFGDQLNKCLLDYFQIKNTHANRLKAEYIFIGSILGWGYFKTINVFGAGFMAEPPWFYFFPRGINAYCLRGKKTKRCVEKITGKKLHNCLLGDPGLLCKDIFPQREEKIYNVGIVCHIKDKKSPYLN